MALTDTQKEVWLNGDFHRIVIADIEYHNGTNLATYHFSSYPYIMPIGDTTLDPIDGITVLSNLIYDDIISTVPNIITRIDAASTVGAIDLLNTDGEYDSLLNNVTLVGHPIRLFIGDTNWPRDNFIPILDGIVSGVSSTAPENIQISLRDRKETLNVPLQTDLFTDATGGTWQSIMDAFASNVPFGLIQGTRAYDSSKQVLPEDIKNTHIPICLGKCFNVEPVLVDSWNHVYMIHTSGDPTIDSLVNISEVRSNGVPLIGSGLLDRVMEAAVISGVFVVGEIITDNTDPLISGEITSLDIVIDNTQLIHYKIADPLHDFFFGSALFTGSISGALGIIAEDIWPSTDGQYEIDLKNGLIRLLDHPNGTQITCDVTAQSARSSLVPGGSAILEPYSAAWIIEWILLEKAGIPFDDLCQVTFPPSGTKGFDNISEMGIYYKDENTVLDIVTRVINSVGGFIRFKDDACKLQLYKLIDPALETEINLYLDNTGIIENGVSVISVEEPKKSITLGYRKNWKTQDEGSLAQAITDIDSPYYNLDTLNSFKNDFTTLYTLTGVSNIEYPLAEDIELIETTLYNKVEAQEELDRRIVLRSTRRRVIRIQSIATSFTFDIGDIVFITHPRFGLNGKNAIIIGVEESPTSKRVTLDVWL